MKNKPTNQSHSKPTAQKAPMSAHRQPGGASLSQVFSRAWIRCDSSQQIGSGHIVRCLALAEQLRDEGLHVTFLCQERNGSNYDAITRAGFELQLLPPENDEIQDAKNVRARISSLSGARTSAVAGARISFVDEAPTGTTSDEHTKPAHDLIVLDHYGLGAKWARDFFVDHFVMVIDDLDNRDHLCHLLLDNNFSMNAEGRYLSLVPSFCKLLLGPQYTLVRREFREFAERQSKMQPRDTNLTNRDGVVCFFGGHDADGYTLRLTKQLQSFATDTNVEKTKTRYRLIVAKTNAHLAELQSLSLPENVTLVVDPPSMANEFLNAELYLGSGGTVTWERMLCGLPGVVMAVADNQVPASRDLAAKNEQWYLGQAKEVSLAHALQFCEEKLRDENSAQLENIRASNLKLVKPLELDVILKAAQDLRLRSANLDDAQFLYDLRRDPTVNAVSIQQTDFTFENHVTWLKKKMADTHSRLFIATAHGESIGQVRFDSDDSRTITVSISLVAQARGKGFASRSLQMATETYSLLHAHDHLFIAYIQPENLASQKAFEAAQFQKSGSEILNGTTFLRYELKNYKTRTSKL